MLEDARAGEISILQRRRVESFLIEARPWAMRQARKKYPHLPDDLYEDVFQQACVEMLRGNPRASDRPGLYAYLSRVLTGVLGRVHKQWCHQHVDLDDDENPVELADPSFTPDDDVDNRQLGAVLNELMNRRLLAPERAVLQLQIGVGLDPDQVKEALGMSDRQYKRRRYEGVQKLRESLEDYMSGRVCAEHSERIVMAASGELGAGGIEELNAHLAHCGGCRAEVRDLRRNVRGRFALAPWPLVISAPGLLAAKAAAVVAVVKGSGSGAGAFSAAKLAAAAVAVTAAAGGGVLAATSGDDRPPAAVAPAPAGVSSAPAGTTGTATPASSVKKAKKKAGAERKAKRRRSSVTGGAAAPSTAAAPATGGGTTSGGAPAVGGQVTDTLSKAVEGVRDTTRKTVDEVQGALPVLPAPVQQGVDKVQDTVDGALAPLSGG